MTEPERALIKELADELESWVENRYSNSKHYPSELRRYERDIEPVKRARALEAQAMTIVERLRAIMNELYSVNGAAALLVGEAADEIEALQRSIEIYLGEITQLRAENERLTAMLEWCDKMEPGIKRRAENSLMTKRRTR